jgi:DNA-binding transcriptional regulator YiaG
MTSTVRIIPCTEPAGLHRHFGQEGEAQPCYIELDLRADTLLATVDVEVGGAVPFSTHYGFERRYGIPVLTAEAANRAMEALRPFAERILADWEEHWNGENMVARLGEDAKAAESAISDHLGLGEASYGGEGVFDASDLVAEWDLEGAVNGLEADEYDIIADTTDDRLAEIASEITEGLAASGESSVAVVHGLDEYLAEIRDGLAEAERMSDAEFRVLRESLGLTADWLAGHLSVSNRTVRHWEQGKYPVPHGVGKTLRDLEEETAALVKETADELLEDYATGPQPEITVYRTDEAYLASDPEPVRSASWHRAFVARVAQQAPVTITYDA